MHNVTLRYVKYSTGRAKQSTRTFSLNKTSPGKLRSEFFLTFFFSNKFWTTGLELELEPPSWLAWAGAGPQWNGFTILLRVGQNDDSIIRVHFFFKERINDRPIFVAEIKPVLRGLRFFCWSGSWPGFFLYIIWCRISVLSVILQ